MKDQTSLRAKHRIKEKEIGLLILSRLLKKIKCICEERSYNSESEKAKHK